MSSVVKKLKKKNLITPPGWLPTNTHYETMMGSVAYQVNSDTSDCDIYGFAIPPRHVIFPHTVGYIPGFGKPPESFEQYQQHHIENKEEGKNYDLSIYSIVKYFQLCMENNPNMIDSLFTPLFCVTHCTKIGNMVRDNRTMFLHKGSYYKFLGYAKSQLHKMLSKDPVGKRVELREEFGWDVKFGYHLARLADEAEQILTHGDLELGRNKEYLKAIRKGEVKEEELRTWFSVQEKHLHKLYTESKLQNKPDEEKIKQLLLNCLEEHYGDLSSAVAMPDRAENAIAEIANILRQKGYV